MAPSLWLKEHPSFGFLPMTEFSLWFFLSLLGLLLSPPISKHTQSLFLSLTHLNKLFLLTWFNFYLLMLLYQVSSIELLLGSPEYGLLLFFFLCLHHCPHTALSFLDWLVTSAAVVPVTNGFRWRNKGYENTLSTVKPCPMLRTSQGWDIQHLKGSWNRRAVCAGRAVWAFWGGSGTSYWKAAANMILPLFK